VLCIGGIIFIISTLVCALTTQIQTLLLARFIQGTGICFMAVPGYASIHESYEQKEAIKILALMGSISVLAPAFGPLLGSLILMLFHWRWIFGFLTIWSSIAIFLLIIWMPETLPSDKRNPLHLSVILKMYGRILCNTQFISTVLILGLVFCGFITWIAAGPFLVINDFKESPIMFSIYQTLIFISYIAANYIVRKLIDKIAIKKLIQFGLMICLIISAVTVGLVIQFPHILLIMIGMYIIYAFGSGFAFAPLNRLTIESTKEPMGSRMAIFSTIMSGFATLASILVTLFYTGTLLSLALIILSLMIILFILKHMINRK
jgi:DHA1 family multidrug/chloramphenicol efflux transport protein-like MFS transporter